VNGTYDRATGIAAANVMLDTKITSDNAPMFDNQHCIIPTTSISLSTENTNAVRFTTIGQYGDGTVVDNTFVVDRIPAGACGGNAVLNWTDIINNQLGLPSLNPGDNILTLHLRMDPPIGP
jgi:hypothetical protein